MANGAFVLNLNDDDHFSPTMMYGFLIENATEDPTKSICDAFIPRTHNEKTMKDVDKVRAFLIDCGVDCGELKTQTRDQWMEEISGRPLEESEKEIQEE